jgi:beta-phosphoglucomutase-like phosphatase (HAD superfamily)
MTSTNGEAPAAVLWDMDGTLVDTEPYWFEAERELAAEYGVEWPDENAVAMVGMDLMDTGAYMRAHGPIPLEPVEIVERLLDGVISRVKRHIPWRDGARDLLAALNAAGIPCVLVTMSWRRFVDPVMEAVPAGSFVATIAGDEVPAGKGKPHPEPYLMGARAAGASPERCVAIEDSPTGVRSALDAGCRVIGVPHVKPIDPAPKLTLVDSLVGLSIADL